MCTANVQERVQQGREAVDEQVQKARRLLIPEHDASGRPIGSGGRARANAIDERLRRIEEGK